jgi:predicted Zn-dependent peptidase
MRNNRLREQLAGTYGVGVQVGPAQRPAGECVAQIQFDADPLRRKELTAAALVEIAALQKTGPTEDELRRAVEPIIRARARARRTNEYWIQLLQLSLDGESFDQLVDDSMLRSVTVQDVRDAARQYLPVSRVQEFNLVPKN